MKDLILTGRTGFERHESLLTEAAGPDASWLLMNNDKTLVTHSTGESATFDEARPTIAWCGLDIFRSPAGRRFFKLVQICPSLQWVQSAYAGHDALIWTDLLDRGVELTRASISGVPIAEYVIGAVLRQFQQPTEWEQARDTKSWTGHVFREIDQSRWVVIGMGDIGRQVSARASAFGAHVTGIRRSPQGDEPVHAMATPDGLVAAVADADVVVLAVPANEDSNHLIGALELESMPARCILVNVGRGNAIDETALLKSLDERDIEAAILDVFADEPLPEDSIWWTHPHVIMTPHVSSMGHGRYRRAAEVFATNLTRRRSGLPLQGTLTAADLL
ncbi:MAG: NAD(P)-dependent oxidoreductase [Acidimicrobiales bacterium]